MAALLRLSLFHSPASTFTGKRFSPSGIPDKSSILFPRIFPAPISVSTSPFPTSSSSNLSQAFTAGGGGAGGGGNRGAGGAGGKDENDGHDSNDQESSDLVGPIGCFLNGWRARVLADPQFPFKVLMEELVGVTACVLGDMASRPNFGLNELDFVFCTLVVGSIVNFALMYLLAPTTSLSSVAANSLPSYMFEPGPFSLVDRIGTLVYKGATFAAVGFAAGIAGTAISNGLIALRKKMDPDFVTTNKAPPTVLNAITWAMHMGLSSNVRYQTLNGVESVMQKSLQPAAFKGLVVVLRCLNNLLGGMSFVILARLTGSQKAGVEEGKTGLIDDRSTANEPEEGAIPRSDSHYK